MAYVNIIGFETGDMTETDNPAGTYSVQSTVKRTGGYAFRVNPTTTGVGYTVARGLDADGTPSPAIGGSDSYTTFYFRADTLPAANDEEIFVLGTNASANYVGLRITSAGLLKLYNAELGTPSLLGTSSAALSTGSFYRIEIRIQAGAAGNYEVKINGTSELSGTANFGTGTLGEMYIGKAVNKNGQTVDFYYDDIAISDSAYPGAGQVNILKPNAAGTDSGWASGTGSTYAEVDETPHDSDTTYLRAAVADNHSLHLESAATGGVAGTIGAVKTVAIVRDEGGASNVRHGFRQGTTVSYTTGPYDPGATYVPIAKIRDTDPVSNSAWTSGDLDSLQVAVTNENGIAARCTALYAMVWSTGQINTTVTPGTLSLTTTRYTPTVILGTKITPGTLSLTTTRYTPTVLTPVVVTPGVPALALTPYAPSATVGLTVTLGAAALTLTPHTPTVINPQSAAPGALGLALTPYALTAPLNNIATPGPGSLSLTPYATSVLTPVVVTPGATSLALTAYAPVVTIVLYLTFGPASLVIVTNGVYIYIPGSADGARQYWRSARYQEYTKLVAYRDYRRATTHKDYIKHVRWVDRA